ncbi:DUF3667 domain-containing protein [Ancylomarina sp. 16SWW S1-10-2]|uniref:DUF3667 domain-containing protein n=1 Tax=Ancylomarina sp. 16SWW S1-10-2 TaxID=2499681 RepID=UPI0012AE8B9E|nr:DUF3667 domain-containing protein [Ancylomarina sp. 16SWW S1-10-2]MRT93635.1 DUF3667 domain-containing protein [Ancylomarina sp. 16SWW S1-10-2]
MICKNCGYNFQGKFCNNCGQNSNVGKVDLKYFLNEIPNSIFQVNRGFLFTIKELFTRPGHSIRQFLEGKRKQHFKPLAFVFLASTLYALLTYLIGKNTFLGGVVTGVAVGLNNGATESSMAVKFLNWLANNHAYAILLFLPFFSLASYLAFIKSKYNYFEHLVLNFYITGQQMVIYLIFSFVLLKDNYLQAIPVVIGILFTFWTFNQFFENNKFYTKIFLTVITYIYCTILIMMFIVGIGAIDK